MRRSFDSVVLGADADGLVAAISLAQQKYRVLVLESSGEPGGAYREIEFAPGFRAAPLAPDLGQLDLRILESIGLSASLRPLPAVPLAALGEQAGRPEPLLLHSEVNLACESLRRVSTADAARWPEFVRQVHAFAQFLNALYRSAPPRIDDKSAGEYLRWLALGRSYRALERAQRGELLRMLPMSVADWLDDWFESDHLKGMLAALAVIDVCQGPMSGGTAFTFLHRHVGAPLGVLGVRAQWQGGSAAFIDALEQRARAAGVVIETNATVRELLVTEEGVTGVVSEDGEEIAACMVISGLDPRRTLLELFDVGHLDPEFVHAVQQIRYRGVASKVLLALEELPPIPGLPMAPDGALVIAPSIKYVERAYDAAKHGGISADPVIQLQFPSVTQPRLAPAGKQVALLNLQFTPYRLRRQSGRGIGDAVERAIALIDEYIPGFTSRIRSRAVLTPADLESTFGLREGAVMQGEPMLDQMVFMRPVPGAARYATPIRGLYLCGSGTHPGPGITGRSGWLAARAAARAHSGIKR